MTMIRVLIVIHVIIARTKSRMMIAVMGKLSHFILTPKAACSIPLSEQLRTSHLSRRGVTVERCCPPKKSPLRQGSIVHRREGSANVGFLLFTVRHHGCRQGNVAMMTPARTSTPAGGAEWVQTRHLGCPLRAGCRALMSGEGLLRKFKESSGAAEKEGKKQRSDVRAAAQRKRRGKSRRVTLKQHCGDADRQTETTAGRGRGRRGRATEGERQKESDRGRAR